MASNGMGSALRGGVLAALVDGRWPSRVRSIVKEAWAAYRVNNWEAADALWTEAVYQAAHRTPSDGYLMWARTRRRAGEFEAAWRASSLGRDGRPLSLNIIVECARIAVNGYRHSEEDTRHVWMSRLQDSETILMGVFARTMATAPSLIALADVRSAMRRFPEALQGLAEVEERYPDRSSQVLIRRAAILRRQGDLDGSHSALDAVPSGLRRSSSFINGLESATRASGKLVADDVVEHLAHGWATGNHDGSAEVLMTALRLRGTSSELMDRVSVTIAGCCGLAEGTRGPLKSLEAIHLDRASEIASSIGGASRPTGGPIIVSGFLYSGSGAVFDALLDRGLQTPFADLEVGFLKKPGHFGTLLGDAFASDSLTSRDRRRVAATTVLSSVFGFGQTGRSLLEFFQESPHLDEFLSAVAELLIDLDRLCSLHGPITHTRLTEVKTVLRRFLSTSISLLSDADGRRVVVNNAIIGHELGLLSVIENSTGVAVLRDPRDQYVSQRLESPNSMPVAEFVPMMRHRLRQFGGLLDDEALRQQILPVKFEEFIVSTRVRETVFQRLGVPLHGISDREASFKPELSQRNVGIHMEYRRQREVAAVHEALQPELEELMVRW